MGSQQPLHLYNTPLIVDTTMGGDITSPSKEIESTRSFCVQFYWTGTTPVGSVMLQGSLDNSHFNDITDSILPVTGNSGSCMINVELPAYGFVRVKYTRTSGTGTANCYINGKQ